MKKSIIAVASLLVVGVLFLAGCQSKGEFIIIIPKRKW
jgi:uncharacterized lipoprotein YajG